MSCVRSLSPRWPWCVSGVPDRCIEGVSSRMPSARHVTRRTLLRRTGGLAAALAAPRSSDRRCPSALRLTLCAPPGRWTRFRWTISPPSPPRSPATSRSMPWNGPGMPTSRSAAPSTSPCAPAPRKRSGGVGPPPPRYARTRCRRPLRRPGDRCPGHADPIPHRCDPRCGRRAAATARPDPHRGLHDRHGPGTDHRAHRGSDGEPHRPAGRLGGG